MKAHIISLLSFIFVCSVLGSDMISDSAKRETSYNLTLNGPLTDKDIIQVAQKLKKSGDILRHSGDDIKKPHQDLQDLKHNQVRHTGQTSDDILMNNEYLKFLSQTRNPLLINDNN